MSSTDSSFVVDHHNGIANARSFVSLEGAAERLTLTAAADPASESYFERHDGPTLLVAAAIYVSWVLLLASHEYVPWWITMPLAGYVVQWHFSLQHEAIHSMRGTPKWLRRALVWPPIGIWFPFELYRRLQESLLLKDEPNRVDPDKWRPLIMSFQQFYGLEGSQVHDSALAKIPEHVHRGPDVDRARNEPEVPDG
jgi:hypothetical protein